MAQSIPTENINFKYIFQSFFNYHKNAILLVSFKCVYTVYSLYSFKIGGI